MRRRLLLNNNMKLKVFEDTYIHGGDQSTNYASSNTLSVKTQGTAVTRRSFLQFKSNDFSKFSKLRIYQHTAGGGTPTAREIAIDVMVNVDLTTLVWTNEPAVDFSNIATFFSFPSDVGWHEIDISSFLSSYFSDTLTLRLRATTSSERIIEFSSKERPINKPPHLK